MDGVVYGLEQFQPVIYWIFIYYVSDYCTENGNSASFCAYVRNVLLNVYFHNRHYQRKILSVDKTLKKKCFNRSLTVTE